MKKQDWLKKIFVTAIVLWHSLSVPVRCQHLSFTRPLQFLKDVQTDKAPSIINFNGDYFIAWKQNQGKLSFSYLGKQYDTASAELIETVPGALTNFAPSFSVLNDKLYLFWISPEGNIKYILSSKDKQPDEKKIYQLAFAKPAPVSQGITTAAVGDKILIATHAVNRDQMYYALLSPGEDGLFKEPMPGTIPNVKI